MSVTDFLKVKFHMLVTILHSTITSQAHDHKRWINDSKGLEIEFFFDKIEQNLIKKSAINHCFKRKKSIDYSRIFG